MSQFDPELPFANSGFPRLKRKTRIPEGRLDRLRNRFAAFGGRVREYLASLDRRPQMDLVALRRSILRCFCHRLRSGQVTTLSGIPEPAAVASVVPVAS